MLTNRPKQNQFVSRWWLSPAGYEIRTAEFHVANDCLLTVDAPGGGCFVESFSCDSENNPWNPELSDKHHDDPKSTWLVTRQFDDPPPKSTGWLGTYDQGLTVYEPLKVRGMHREFAGLGGDQSAILSFAKRFGFLGASTWSICWDENEDLAWGWGETVEEWEAHSNRLRLLIDLWDMFRDANSTDEQLAEFVEFDTDRAFFRDEMEERYSPLASTFVLDDEFWFPYVPQAMATESIVRRAARTVLRETVKAALDINASPYFDLGPAGQISIAPSNLLGAIYVHFLQELLGRSDPLFRCASCGKWFIQRHAGRIYCGQACKQKAYRRGLTKQKATDGD